MTLPLTNNERQNVDVNIVHATAFDWLDCLLDNVIEMLPKDDKIDTNQ